jgi:hypothetical protein
MKPQDSEKCISYWVGSAVEFLFLRYSSLAVGIRVWVLICNVYDRKRMKY